MTVNIYLYYTVILIFVIGFINLLKNILIFFTKLFLWIRLNFMCSTCASDNLKTTFGEWAVVTGGTDGIGKAYARELARRGVNIVIISRNLAKLNKVAREIEKDYGVMTKVVQMDFSVGKSKSYDTIKNQIKDLDIGILVNNVGVAVPYPLRVSEMTESMIWDLVNVNVAAVTLMTQLVLPAMMTRRRGVIVNLSSLSAVAPTPYLTVYASTKAYIENFSEALRFECRGTGIKVQTLCPGFVNTKMINFSSELRKGGLLVPSAETFAKNAVSSLRFSGKTSGYWSHDVQYWVCSMMPKSMWIKISGYFNIYIRNKYDSEQNNKTQQGAQQV